MGRMSATVPKRKLSDPALQVQVEEVGRRVEVWRGYGILLLVCLTLCCLHIYYGLAYVKHQHKAPQQSADFAPGLDKLHKDLNFTCNITDRDALSAISRAVTQECKREIGELVCRIQAGSFYPASLPHYCPAHIRPELQGTKLGCFKDSFSPRLLQGYVAKLKGENSPGRCVQFCQDAGFSYAGTQYGVECFCGNSQPSVGQALQEADCNMPCSGNSSMTCGGYLTMEVYHTGLTHLAPPKLGVEMAESTSDVRVVYLLTVNGRALRQVIRLIKRLMSKDSYFLIHVDSRQDYLHRELLMLTHTHPNIRMATNRFSTIWGGASLLTMLLSSIQELLLMKDWDWDFVLNLSESDYPIKTREELVRFLSANKDKNFVKSHGREPENFIKKQGLDKTFYQCENHMWRLGNRQLPLGIQVDGGSDWICLNRPFASYLTESRDPLLTGLKLVFNHTLLPAESFFHTVLQNSVFCNSYINNNLHLTNWKRKQGCKCQYRAIVDWCGCSPNDFLEDDWSRLAATKTKQLFFARKFEPIVHQEIINRVEDWLHIPLAEEERDHYWQNVYHHLDRFPIPTSDFLLLMKVLCQKSLELDSNTIGWQVEKTLEVTIYKYKDEVDSVLVYFQARGAGQLLQLEMAAQHAVPNPLGTVESRILDLEVGTDFDPKEQIFRNMVRNFGPAARISLSLQFEEGEASQTLDIGWFNPVGRLAATSQLVMNASEGLENVEAKLRPPHLPGVWTVVVVSRAQLLAKENFLIIPDGSEIKFENTNSVTNSKLSKYVSVSTEERSQIVEELKNLSFGTGEQWLARRLPSFFTVSGLCASDATSTAGAVQLPRCAEQRWSSRSPDLKSNL